MRIPSTLLANSQKFCEAIYARVVELVLGSTPAGTPGWSISGGVTGLSRQLAAIPSAALARNAITANVAAPRHLKLVLGEQPRKAC
jgi:hypothetical protein